MSKRERCTCQSGDSVSPTGPSFVFIFLKSPAFSFSPGRSLPPGLKNKRIKKDKKEKEKEKEKEKKKKKKEKKKKKKEKKKKKKRKKKTI